ncbi:MAG: pilus assembly protein PilC, partial [Verrucomicrobia bacterium]
MPRFQYVALDARGQESTGSVDANSTNEAIGRLRQAGYFPTGVYEEGKAPAARNGKVKKPRTTPIVAAAAPAAKRKGVSITLFKKQKVKSRVLMIFTRQLATLIDSGLPLLRSLNVLARQERDPVLKRTTEALSDSVQGGNTFSDSLAQHPKIFNDLYVSMVKAGELGGVLEVVLQRLAEFQEKAQKIKGKVLSAMIYPAIVMTMAVAIMGFLLVFIVPRFEAIFKDMLGDKPLPGITIFVISISRFAQSNWAVLIGAGIALIVGIKVLGRTSGGRSLLDQFKLRLPLFGDLIRKTSISRFSRTLGTLVTSGVSILQALNITRD